MSILQTTLSLHFDTLIRDASDYGYVHGPTQKQIDQLRAVWSALDHNARRVTVGYVYSVHSKPLPLPGNHSLKAYLPAQRYARQQRERYPLSTPARELLTLLQGAHGGDNFKQIRLRFLAMDVASVTNE
jgi:hypothetical protein